jgi:hypothetical protein
LTLLACKNDFQLFKTCKTYLMHSDKKNNVAIFRIVVLELIVLFFLSCGSPEKNAEPLNDEIDKLISYELIKTLSLEDIEIIRTEHLKQFLTGATMPFSAFEGKLEKPKYAVKLYKVTYRSIIPEQDNKPVITTGLIAIPEIESKELPLISYQHGTIFDRSWAPSAYENAYEVHFMVSQFAAQGYILIAADYFGLEDSSKLPNSYFVHRSNAQACMDMYAASLEILQKERIKNNKFFIGGWSQGAYNTMIFLRTLERENIPVQAAFTAAAPVDPLLFITRGLFNPRDIDALFSVGALCNLIFSFEEAYNGDYSSKYIKPAYYQTARDLFDFKISFEDFMKTVPVQYDQVFSQDLFTDARLVTGQFWPLVGTSEAYKWLSITPLKSFGGGMDEAVPEYVSFLGIEYMRLLGKKDVEAISSGVNADHRCTYIHSLITSKPWIDSF